MTDARASHINAKQGTIKAQKRLFAVMLSMLYKCFTMISDMFDDVEQILLCRCNFLVALFGHPLIVPCCLAILLISSYLHLPVLSLILIELGSGLNQSPGVQKTVCLQLSAFQMVAVAVVVAVLLFSPSVLIIQSLLCKIITAPL
jgi:hypothetical protein